MAEYVDHAEIKLGQIVTIAISAVALLQQQIFLLSLLGVAFLLSGTIRIVSPFALIYRRLVQPLGLMRSDYRLDNIQPHKFGQLIGAFTIVLAIALVNLGYPLAGWGVVAVLLLLTAVSYAGWCIGCYLYYQIQRLGLGGFFRHAPKDKSVFPGVRPRRDDEGE